MSCHKSNSVDYTAMEHILYVFVCCTLAVQLGVMLMKPPPCKCAVHCELTKLAA